MKPNHSISQIGKAGRKLRKDDIEGDQRERCLEVLAYWRTQHSAPLATAFDELESATKQVDDKGELVSREKRAKSIVDKLKRETSMSLTTMQDIGGCRGIVRVQKDALKIAKALRKKKHITLANNYIKKPKKDGYRGIHLVGKYDTDLYNGIRIEFQIRTKIQHSWATAGEITELFAATPIKNLHGDTKWKHFYRLVGDCLSIIDSSYITRDFDPERIDTDETAFLLRSKHGSSIADIAKEIKHLSKELQVQRRFEVFRSSLNFTDTQGLLSYKYFVIHAKELNTQSPVVNVHAGNDLVSMQKMNFEIEKCIVSDNNELVVMLTVGALVDLQAAYPNYFADSGYFLKLLQSIEKI